MAEAVLPLPATWADGGGPLHRRLSAAIESLIASGALADGTMLPTERELASVAAVSRDTVARAYRGLKAAGWIESRQGRGTWVATRAARESGAGRTAERIGPLLAPHPETVDLASAVPRPVGPLRVEFTAGVGGYEPSGLPALREAIADHCSERGLATTADQVLVTSGAQQAISLAMAELVRPGDVVLVEESTYVGALDAARAVGARVVGIPIGDGGIDPDELGYLVDVHHPKVVYLNPIHHTPTGSVMGVDRRRQVVAMALRTGVAVIDDGVLAGLGWGATPGPPDVPLAAYDRRAPILTVGSLSKVVWPGLRVGWVRAERSIIEALTARRMVADLGGSIPAQIAAVELVRDYRAHADRQAQLLRASHDRMVDSLRDALPQWEVPSARGGTVLWVALPDGADAEVFALLAETYGVSVVAGPSVSVPGAGRDRLRISFVAPIEVLDEGVARLARAWADFNSSPRARRARPLLV